MTAWRRFPVVQDLRLSHARLRKHFSEAPIGFQVVTPIHYCQNRRLNLRSNEVLSTQRTQAFCKPPYLRYASIRSVFSYVRVNLVTVGRLLD